MQAGTKRSAADSNETSVPGAQKRARVDESNGSASSQSTSSCPYLAFVDRKALDFELARRCSVSMATSNVHMCLVCGKYVQGRGKESPAFRHSLETDHYLYLSFDDASVWCLPDNYEVKDPSLDDITQALRPSFTSDDIVGLDGQNVLAKSMDGREFLPGYVGIDSPGGFDYVSVALQCLSHVPPFRDFFLRPSNYSLCTSELVAVFGSTMRRMWSSGLFKPTLSPRELLVYVTKASNGRFRAG